MATHPDCDKKIDGCREDIDRQIETINSSLERLHKDMTDIKEILEAWNNAKGFVTGIRVFGGILRFLALTSAAAIAVWALLHGQGPK